MAKKSKKRVFTKKHLAALRAAAAKRRGKPRGKKKLSAQKIADEATQRFISNQLHINDPTYGMKIGDKLRVRLPNDYVITETVEQPVEATPPMIALLDRIEGLLKRFEALTG